MSLQSEQAEREEVRCPPMHFTILGLSARPLELWVESTSTGKAEIPS